MSKVQWSGWPWKKHQEDMVILHTTALHTRTHGWSWRKRGRIWLSGMKKPIRYLALWVKELQVQGKGQSSVKPLVLPALTSRQHTVWVAEMNLLHYRNLITGLAANGNNLIYWAIWVPQQYYALAHTALIMQKNPEFWCMHIPGYSQLTKSWYQVTWKESVWTGRGTASRFWADQWGNSPCDGIRTYLGRQWCKTFVIYQWRKKQHHIELVAMSPSRWEGGHWDSGARVTKG